MLTFQIYLSEKFKNNLIKNKAEESVYQIWRLIKKLELSRVCGIAGGQTHGTMHQYREPRSRPTQIAQLLYDKGAQAIQWRQHSLVNKRCWSNQASIQVLLLLLMNKVKPQSKFHILYKNQLKTDHGLKWKIWNHKIFGRKNTEKISATGLGKEFLHLTKIIQPIKCKIGKMNFIQIKTFCSGKTLLSGWKDKL